jgi:hypothetical protein
VRNKAFLYIQRQNNKKKGSQELKKANKDGSSVFVPPLYPRTYIIKLFSLHIAYAEGDILLRLLLQKKT